MVVLPAVLCKYPAILDGLKSAAEYNNKFASKKIWYDNISYLCGLERDHVAYIEGSKNRRYHTRFGGKTK